MEKIPLFILAAMCCAMTWYAQQNDRAIQSLEEYPFGVRASNALLAYVGYLRKTLWPVDLAVFYPHPRTAILVWQAIIAGFALLATTVLILVREVKAPRQPYLVVGWLWYLGTLVPVIGLVQVGSQAMADRYTYVPLIGVFIMATWGAADLLAHLRFQQALKPLTGLLLLIWGIYTWAQVQTWENDVTLWEQALAVTDNNLMAHKNLALALERRGRPVEAIRHYQAALTIDPEDAEAHNNMGAAMAMTGNVQGAIPFFREALRLNPAYSAARNNLDLALKTQELPRD